jgi:hypothetical protein
MVLGINEGLDVAGYMMALVRLSDVDPDLHAQNSAFQGHLLDGLIIVSDIAATTPEHLEKLVPHSVWLDSTVWHDTTASSAMKWRPANAPAVPWPRPGTANGSI